jgi:hypothetical protein
MTIMLVLSSILITLALVFYSTGIWAERISGQIALWLMLAHAIWATIVIRNKNKYMMVRFHRYSLFVWIIWLIPYFGGMYLAMNH